MAGRNFRLCQLPNKATKLVVQCMPDIERVVISFCSKRMKSMAISPGERNRNFRIKIGENCEISYRRTSRYICWDLNHFTGEEEVRVGPWFYGRNQTIIWEQPGWSMAERFNHVHDLFPDIKNVYVSFHSDTFDLNLLPLLHLSDVSKLVLPRVQGNSVFNVQLLNYFQQVNGIRLWCRRFENSSQVTSVLIRNLHILEINFGFKISFSELLSINARYLFLTEQRLTGKQINMFLKLWIRGSHPRLRYFQYIFDDWTQLEDLNSVLTGTNSRHLPDTNETQYVNSDGRNITIHGGFEIWNKHGIKGIVKFDEDESEIEFIVIDD